MTASYTSREHSSMDHTSSLHKRCNRCREEKPLDRFSKRKDAPDGHDYRCRDCENIRRESHRLANLGKERERCRAYAHNKRLKSPDDVNAALRNWRKNNPERSSSYTQRRRELYPEMAEAHLATRGMAAKGMVAHHWSYLEEHRLDVIMMSRKEHARLHRLVRYSQQDRRYRHRETGALLVKEDHEALLSTIIAQ